MNKKYLTYVISGLCVGALVLTIGYSTGFSLQKKENKQVSVGNNSGLLAKNGSNASYKPKNTWYGAPDSEKMSKLEKWGKKVPDVSVASQSAEYSVKSPTDSLDKKLLGIYVGQKPAVDEKPEVTLLFENGLHINQVTHKVPSKPDYDQVVAEDAQYKKDGILKSDSIPQIVTIHGQKGIGQEPGFNDIDGVQDPRPGYVSWYDNGFYYTVYGENIALKDLLKVANSMQ